MRRTCGALFLICVILGGFRAPLRAFGAEDVGTTSADFLKLGSGARSEAMGEAYVGLADDTDGLAYNPAGLAQNLSGELSASEGLWFQGLSYDNFNALLPGADGGVLGAGFDYLASQPLAHTLLVGSGSNPDPGQNYVTEGSFTPYDLLASLAYARPLGWGWLGGASLKLTDQNIDGFNGYGLGLDLGGLWRTPVEGLNVGLSAQNLGTPVNFGGGASPLPFIARGGASYSLPGKILLLSVEGDLPADSAPVLAGGAEINIAGRLYPRVGWRYDGEFNPWTLGFGLRYDTWGLDLSAVPYGALGMTYRASLDWRFGGPVVRLAARFALLSASDAGRPVELDFGMSAPDEVRAWAVYIYDSGRPAGIVRSFSGFGPPQGPLAWDGKEQGGGPAPDGVYWALLSLRYVGGQTAASPYVRLEVSSGAPTAGLSLDPDALVPGSPGEAVVPTIFRLALKSGRGIAAWRLEILDPAGRIFRRIEGAGLPPATAVWDGKGDQGDELVSAQVYGARLWVRNALGAEGMSPTVSFKAVFR